MSFDRPQANTQKLRDFIEDYSELTGLKIVINDEEFAHWGEKQVIDLLIKNVTKFHHNWAILFMLANYHNLPTIIDVLSTRREGEWGDILDAMDAIEATEAKSEQKSQGKSYKESLKKTELVPLKIKDNEEFDRQLIAFRQQHPDLKRAVFIDSTLSLTGEQLLRIARNEPNAAIIILSSLTGQQKIEDYYFAELKKALIAEKNLQLVTLTEDVQQDIEKSLQQLKDRILINGINDELAKKYQKDYDTLFAPSFVARKTARALRGALSQMEGGILIGDDTPDIRELLNQKRIKVSSLQSFTSSQQPLVTQSTATFFASTSSSVTATKAVEVAPASTRELISVLSHRQPHHWIELVFKNCSNEELKDIQKEISSDLEKINDNLFTIIEAHTLKVRMEVDSQKFPTTGGFDVKVVDVLKNKKIIPKAMAEKIRKMIADLAKHNHETSFTVNPTTSVEERLREFARDAPKICVGLDFNLTSLDQTAFFQKFLDKNGDATDIFREYWPHLITLATYFELPEIVASINTQLQKDKRITNDVELSSLHNSIQNGSLKIYHQDAFNRVLGAIKIKVDDYHHFDGQLAAFCQRNQSIQHAHFVDFDNVVTRFHTYSSSYDAVGKGAHASYATQNNGRLDDREIAKNIRKGYGEMLLQTLEKDPHAAIIAITHGNIPELVERYYIVAIKSALMERGGITESAAAQTAKEMVTHGRIMINCTTVPMFDSRQGNIPPDTKATKIARALSGQLSTLKSGSFMDDDPKIMNEFVALQEKIPMMKKIQTINCTQASREPDYTGHFDTFRSIATPATEVSKDVASIESKINRP